MWLVAAWTFTACLDKGLIVDGCSGGVDHALVHGWQENHLAVAALCHLLHSLEISGQTLVYGS